jgi:hypothetical protein
MKDVFVNAIVEENALTHGICFFEEIVAQNFDIIYDTKATAAAQVFRRTSAEGDYMITRYAQFIVLLENNPEMGLVLRFTEFEEVDAALDEYLAMTDKRWSQGDFDKIMRLQMEVKENDHERARLVVIDTFNQ